MATLQSSIDQAPADICDRMNSGSGRRAECPPRCVRVEMFPRVTSPFHVSQALEMPPAEMEARSRKDLAHIHSNTSEDWGRRYAHANQVIIV